MPQAQGRGSGLPPHLHWQKPPASGCSPVSYQVEPKKEEYGAYEVQEASHLLFPHILDIVATVFSSCPFQGLALMAKMEAGITPCLVSVKVTLLGHLMEVEKAGGTEAYTSHLKERQQVRWSHPPGSFLALMSCFHTTRLSHVTPRDFWK